MGMGRSRHKSAGWKSQLARTLRWYKRVIEIGKQRSLSDDMEREHDELYAFFQNCYHLRDWLINSGTVSSDEVNSIFKSSIELKICRDICNGTKHFEITTPSIDANFSIIREYVPAAWSGERPHINENWQIIAGPYKYDLFELAKKCVDVWLDFLVTQGLPIEVLEGKYKDGSARSFRIVEN